MKKPAKVFTNHLVTLNIKPSEDWVLLSWQCVMASVMEYLSMIFLSLSLPYSHACLPLSKHWCCIFCANPRKQSAHFAVGEIRETQVIKIQGGVREIEHSEGTCLACGWPGFNPEPHRVPRALIGVSLEHLLVWPKSQTRKPANKLTYKSKNKDSPET